MLGDDTHLWFNIDYLPSVKDIDLLLWHESVGVFAIEVKAVQIEAFTKFNLSRCTIKGRKEGKSPHAQAQAAEQDLRNYLNRRMTETPFMVATSVFPLIGRAEWNQYWNSDDITGKWADRILFADDIDAGPLALKNRLAHIRVNPPSRAGSKKPWVHQKAQLQSFNKAVAPPDAQPQPTRSDQDRLRAIERNVAKASIEGVPAFGGTRVGFSGHPGTGKTFRLLEIGAAHADQQADVLFLCFNKVLAADIRRLLQWRQSSATNDGISFDVYDVHQLLNLLIAERGLERGEGDGDFDAHNELVVDMLEDVRDEIASYDTVLLDEAQDLVDWQIRLAELHLKEGGTFAVGIGTGQELYESGLSERLTTLLDEITVTPLRKNFRNTKETFQTAFVAHECKLDKDEIREAATRFRTDLTKSKQEGISFERTEGRFPILKPVVADTLSNQDQTKGFYVDQEKELLIEAYSQLIAQELAQLDEDDHPVDLLILVPGKEGQEADAARSALRRIDQEYFDLTEEGARRAVVPSTAVRLCTFHSARGIEANRVLILGFARLKGLCHSMGISPERLAYVILSRSVFETVIAVRSNEWDSELIVFMQEAINHLQTHR